jgi:hypothetical protein
MCHEIIKDYCKQYSGIVINCRASVAWKSTDRLFFKDMIVAQDNWPLLIISYPKAPD